MDWPLSTFSTHFLVLPHSCYLSMVPNSPDLSSMSHLSGIHYTFIVPAHSFKAGFLCYCLQDLFLDLLGQTSILALREHGSSSQQPRNGGLLSPAVSFTDPQTKRLSDLSKVMPPGQSQCRYKASLSDLRPQTSPPTPV